MLCFSRSYSSFSEEYVLRCLYHLPLNSIDLSISDVIQFESLWLCLLNFKHFTGKYSSKIIQFFSNSHNQYSDQSRDWHLVATRCGLQKVILGSRSSLCHCLLLFGRIFVIL